MGNIICPQITGQSSANPAELGLQKQRILHFFLQNNGPARRGDTIYPFLSYEFRKDLEIVSLSLSDLCRNYNQAEQIISWIPDNLFNDRNFILSLDIDVSSGIYRHLSIELQRDYEILLKFGYRYISSDEAYNRIMTPEMKSDVELHRKLMELNPNIRIIATNNTNIVPKIKYTPIILRLIYWCISAVRGSISLYLSAKSTSR
jgi:hypothetical protein